MNQKTKPQKFTAALFVIYMLILTWIILFKMQFSLEGFGRFRNINLIPYAGSVIVNGKVQLSEIFQNIIIFIPVGIYLSMLKSNLSFVKKALSIAGFSLLLEILQYILAVGATDITDLINNTLGGIIGIGIYAAVDAFVKPKEKANRIFNILAAIGTVCLCALLLLLIVANL